MEEKIIGLDKEINLLKTLYKQGKIASSYLFLGKEGIGKKKIALHLAKILNCQKHQPCQKCQDCLLIDNNCHPDVYTISPEKSISIEDIRTLKNKTYIKSISHWKVFIINDAHKLTIEAANAFLKIQEEPPENTTFILITHKLNMLPKTIQSRAVKIWLSPNAEQIKTYLKTRYPQIPAQQIDYLLGVYENSLGKIKNFIDSKETSIADETTKVLLSAEDFFNFNLSLKKKRQALKEELSFLMLFLRDCLVAKITPNSILLNSPYYEIINTYQKGCSPEELIKKFSKVVEIYNSAENINMYLAAKLLTDIFYG